VYPGRRHSAHGGGAQPRHSGQCVEPTIQSEGMFTSYQSINMAQDLVRCFEEFAKLVRLYQVRRRGSSESHLTHPPQSEIPTLLAGLQELSANRGQEAPADNINDSEHPDPVSVTTDEGVRTPPLPERGDQSADQPDSSDHVGEHTRKLKCPHPDCEEEKQTFSRTQDLERHYALRAAPILE